MAFFNFTKANLLRFKQNIDTYFATKAELQAGLAEAKAYTDSHSGGGSSSSIGWGIATSGTVSLSSTTAVTIDISSFGFQTADEYVVLATMTDTATTAYNAKVFNKTATNFQIRKSGSGNNIPAVYVVFAEGYGGGLTYRDLILDNAMSDTSENGVKNKIIKAYVDAAIGVDTALSTTSESAVQNKVITNKFNDLEFQLNGLGEPYRLKDFSQTFSSPITVPVVTSNVANTSIPNIDITITGDEATDFAIAGLMKYELKDASGNRINAFPVCTFSMSGQTVLRLRMMAAGTSDVAASSIQGAILLKHR